MAIIIGAGEARRYHRQLVLNGFGVRGQRKLKNASVLVVGGGGLGAPVLQYLTASGVGRIGIVDGDTVDDTNLQRQVLYSVDDIGRNKAECAASVLGRLNPYVHCEPICKYLNQTNAFDVIAEYDLVVDGSDNLETRYLVHDVSYWLSKPYIYGAVFQFSGQASTFIPGKSPCYRCLFPTRAYDGSPPSCSMAGVLGVVPGLVGCVQAGEVIKLISGCGENLAGRLLSCDVLSMRFREATLPRDPQCPLCSSNPSISWESHYAQSSDSFPPTLSCADDQHDLMSIEEITVGELLGKLEKLGRQKTLVDIREPAETDSGVIPQAVCLPMSNLDVLVENILAKTGEVVVYCRTGIRSARLVYQLRKLIGGRDDIQLKSLVGGIIEWYQQVGIDDFGSEQDHF